MAIHKGSEGTVKVGSNAIANIRSYSIEESADTLEQTIMGATSRAYVASLSTFSGSVDVYWDETDTSGQGALTIGAEGSFTDVAMYSPQSQKLVVGSIVMK